MAILGFSNTPHTLIVRNIHINGRGDLWQQSDDVSKECIYTDINSNYKLMTPFLSIYKHQMSWWRRKISGSL